MILSVAKYWNDFIALVYPKVCVGCGSDALSDEGQLCLSCIQQLPLTGFERRRNNVVENIFTGRIYVEMASSFLYFGKMSMVQRLIHQLKYKGNKDLGILLGRMMGETMKSAGWQDVIDIIVPLPLNKKKALQRGYNQSAVLAAGVGQALDKPIALSAVSRTIFTQTQTAKNRSERWQNMEGTFVVNNGDDLKNKHVLLIDDIVTTGSTLESCGLALLQIPGIKLSMATLAFASKI